jgi:CheY-like chemotaxis protein
LGAALAKQRGGSSEDGTYDPILAGHIVESVTPRIFRQTSKSQVLWVDDNPGNNVHERRALEVFGINFVLAKSTEEALEKIQQQSFDAIISDMGRPGDSTAGFTLLQKLRSAGNKTPFISSRY